MSQSPPPPSHHIEKIVEAYVLNKVRKPSRSALIKEELTRMGVKVTDTEDGGAKWELA